MIVARRILPALLLVAAACSGRAEHTPRERAPDAPEATRVHEEVPTDALGRTLHEVIVERSGRLEDAGTPRRGRLGRGMTEEHFVLGGGYCYAFFVAADESAGELSLRLLDDRNEPINVDRERGSIATLGLAEPLCAERPISVRLEIDGERGREGEYLVRLFRATAL